MIMTDAKKTEIYAQNFQKVYNYIHSRIADKALAEDLCSDVFVKVFSSLDSFDSSRASLSTWIYTIARNTLTDHFRTRRPTEEIPETLADSGSLEEDVCREEELDTLADALESLDERSRRIIIFHYYSGLTLRETATRIGLSYSQTKLIHTSALARLKKFF